MKLLLMFGMLWGGLYLASRKAPQPTVNDLAPTFFETEDTVPTKQQYNLVKPSQSALISDGSANKVKYLTVGDTVPDILLYNVDNPSTITPLNTVTSELTILDFWSSYCVPCMQAFPKMDSLQREFKKSLSIFLVTCDGDVEDLRVSAKKTLDRMEAQWKTKLLPESVYIDTATVPLFFPQVSVPHYIWLDKNKKIIAVTNSEDVNAANIGRLLAGDSLSLVVKPSTTRAGKGKPIQKHIASLPK